MSRPLVLDDVYSVGAPTTMLSTVGAVAFGPSGILYFLDAAGTTVRLLAVTDMGRHVREVGRRGEGPGEFSMITHFAVLDDDRVAAFDARHNAYLIFGADDGAFERMVALNSGVGRASATMDLTNIGRTARGERGRPGMISLNRIAVDLSAVTSGQATMMFSGHAIERIDVQGDEAKIDTLLVAWSPELAEDTRIGPPEMRLTVRGPRMFEPAVRYDVLPDGMVALSDSTTYTIKIVDRDGTVVRVLRRPLAPRPVTARMRQSAKESLRSRQDEIDRRMPPEAAEFMKTLAEQQIEQMTFYHEVSVVAGLLTGWEGTIWVMRTGDDPWLDESEGAIDVLTKDGEYLGTLGPGIIDTPRALGPNGLAAFVEVDSLGVPTVIVKRLPEGYW